MNKKRLHKLESVIGNEMHNILRHFEIQTDRPVSIISNN